MSFCRFAPEVCPATTVFSNGVRSAYYEAEFAWTVANLFLYPFLLLASAQLLPSPENPLFNKRHDTAGWSSINITDAHFGLVIGLWGNNVHYGCDNEPLENGVIALGRRVASSSGGEMKVGHWNYPRTIKSRVDAKTNSGVAVIWRARCVQTRVYILSRGRNVIFFIAHF